MSDSSSPKDLNNLLATQPTPTANSTTEPITSSPVALREELIKSAVSFLSSPNVKSAEDSKKIAFLQKKGLTQPEIDEAFKRVGNAPVISTTPSVSNSTATNNVPIQSQPLAPILPTRNVQPQVVYYPQPVAPPMPAEKVFALAVVLGLGTVGATAGIIGLLRRFISPIFNRIAEYQRSRYNQRRDLADKLLKSLKSYQLENDDLDAVIDQGEEKTVGDALVKHQAELSSKLDSLAAKTRAGALQVSDLDTYDHFRTDISNFKETIVSSPFSDLFNSGFSYNHYSRSSTNDSPAVAGLKSDIRSLKAMLLNRRNFPTV